MRRIDKQNLIDLLNQARSLQLFEHQRAQNLKRKAADAYMSLYSISPNEIQNIKFESVFGMATESSQRNDFYNGKAKLELAIEGLLDFIRKNEQLDDQKEKLSLRSNTLAVDINKDLISNYELYSQNRNLELAKSKLETEKSDLIRQKELAIADLSKAKMFRIIKEIMTIVGLIGAGVAAGSFAVAVKIDYDKRELQIILDKQTDSLNKLNNKVFELEKIVDEQKR